MHHLFATVITICFSISLLAGPDNPIELGKVTWLRDLASAQQLAQKLDKPILILFQEIPGCNTCKQYGKAVLSHPLLVEAIETNFIPLAIYNNRKGKDAQVLTYYQEPTWNNPVVRIVGSDKKDLLPRLHSNYTPAGLANYMIKALQKTKRSVPGYLKIMKEELEAQELGLEKTTLSMYCFWTGEKELGKLGGVTHTEAGWMDGREVVNVYFNPQEISLGEIITEGSNSRCADRIYTSDEKQAREAKKIAATKPVKVAKSFRLDKQPKYYLSHTIYQYVPMSPMQAVKANALIGERKKPEEIFSTRQLAMAEYFMEAREKKSAIHDPNWTDLYFQIWNKIKERS